MPGASPVYAAGVHAEGAPSREQRNVAARWLDENDIVAAGSDPGVQAIVVSGAPASGAGFAFESLVEATSALTTTGVEVPMFSAASCARTRRVYAPLAFGVHVNVYGATYFVATTTPSAIRSTFPTPTSSETVAETATPSEPTSVPRAGDVSDTVGGVASGHAAAVPERTASAASRIVGRDDFAVSSA